MYFRWKRRQINENQKFSILRISVLLQAFDKIGSNYALSANTTKICLLGYFHAEFISAMKTVQNPTIFVKNAKEQKND